MNLSKRPCLIYFATQPGATSETFDRERCRREIVNPARDVLEREGLVDTALFIIVCDPKAPAFEVATAEIPPENGCSLAPHLVTPTSAFLVEELRRERGERRIEYLNVPSGSDFPGSILGYAVSFSRSCGCDGVIVSPEGAPFPTVDEVFEAATTLEMGKVITISRATAPA